MASIAASGDAFAFLDCQQFHWTEPSNHPQGSDADPGGVAGPGIDHFANIHPRFNGSNLTVLSPWANAGLSAG